MVPNTIKKAYGAVACISSLSALASTAAAAAAAACAAAAATCCAGSGGTSGPKPSHARPDAPGNMQAMWRSKSSARATETSESAWSGAGKMSVFFFSHFVSLSNANKLRAREAEYAQFFDERWPKAKLSKMAQNDDRPELKVIGSSLP